MPNYSFLPLLVLWCCLGCAREPAAPSAPPGVQSGLRWRADTIGGVPVLLFADPEAGWLTAFGSCRPDGSTVRLQTLAARPPALFTDAEGNQWTVEGRAASGPRAGAYLPRVRTSGGYWFALSGALPNLLLDGGAPPLPYPTFARDSAWLVSPELVFRGAVEDAIPAIDAPVHAPYDPRQDAADNFYLRGDDRVLGVWHDGVLRLYPHKILNHHEIVNEADYAVVYGPLSGTSQVWAVARAAGDGGIGFGVSGLTHASVVLAFDRATGSRWEQFGGRCVNGPRRGETVPFLHYLEATWTWWQQNYPDALLLRTDTGYVNDYSVDNFADYAADADNFPFPRPVIDTRLPPKTYVHVVLTSGGRKAYRLADF